MSKNQNEQAQFVEALYQAIEGNNMSIKDAAERCRISEQSIRNYLSLASWPSASQAELLIDRLHLPKQAAARAWFYGHLERQGASFLSNVVQREISDQEDEECFSKAAKSIRDNPSDELTDGLIADVATRIRQYRRDLTSWELANKSLRIQRHGPAGYWQNVPGNDPIQHLPVGMHRAGIGFLASWIRIPAGYGAFHKHVSGRFLDSGTEIFVIVEGAGHLLVESPHDDKKRGLCQSFVLEPHISGHYYGRYGHLFLATGSQDLVLFTVCIPVPPELARGKPMAPNPEHGVSRGAAFDISGELPVLPRGFVEALNAIRSQKKPAENNAQS